MWFLNSNFWENYLLHLSHLNGFSPYKQILVRYVRTYSVWHCMSSQQVAIPESLFATIEIALMFPHFLLDWSPFFEINGFQLIWGLFNRFNGLHIHALDSFELFTIPWIIASIGYLSRVGFHVNTHVEFARKRFTAFITFEWLLSL